MAPQPVAPQNLEEWLALGINMGWSSEYFCDAHDAPPMSEEDEVSWEFGDDNCAFHVRIWFEGRPEVVTYGRELLQ